LEGKLYKDLTKSFQRRIKEYPIDINTLVPGVPDDIREEIYERIRKRTSTQECDKCKSSLEENSKKCDECKHYVEKSKFLKLASRGFFDENDFHKTVAEAALDGYNVKKWEKKSGNKEELVYRSY
jgi:hypothetical protein